MKAPDRDLRERVLRAVDRGEPMPRVAARLEVGDSTAKKWSRRSPDPNPVGKVFSKVKGLLRFAAARTRDALWDAIAFALDAVTPADCRNLFRSCGYRLRQT
jgi:hypothetical protein